MARLSESSVVAAIRDWQWLVALDSPDPNERPKPFLALSGKAEAALGDVALKQGERLFLFEVKATRSEIREEWSRASAAPDPGSPTPPTAQGDALRPEPTRLAKLAFLWAASRLREWEASPEDDELRARLRRSLQAHHFAYWRKIWGPADAPEGHLVLEPYVLAIADRHADFEAMGEAFKHSFGVARTTPVEPIDDMSSVYFLTETSLQIGTLVDKVGKLIERAPLSHGSAATWHDLGLEMDEFQAYVKDLAGDVSDGDISIRAVVMSDKGSVCMSVGTVGELARLFDPPPVPKALAKPRNKPPRPPETACSYQQQMAALPAASLVKKKKTRSPTRRKP